MSTALSGSAPEINMQAPEGMRVAIVTAQWNSKITHRLRDSAVRQLRLCGLEMHQGIDLYDVPGAVELNFAAARLTQCGRYDAIIVFGCVIRGGTPHFDYVCQSVTQGVTSLNIEGQVPVIFGVLTVDSEHDAMVRCDGTEADKGAEAAQAAVAMGRFAQSVKK